jgi:hypothetical protein
MKLFISYSSRDRDAVKNLAQDLESAVKTLPHQSEFGVWFDQELIGGHDWWSNILSAIYHSDLFIFALTPESLDSAPCKLEYTYAHHLNKRILPILLAEGVNPGLLASELQRLQFVDYRAADKPAYQRLLTALANLPAPQSPPNPLPTPPDAPVSPLAQMKAQLEAPSLDLDTQLKMVFQLKQYLGEPDKAAGARELLQQLSHHPDVRAAIAQDIGVILGSAPPPAPVMRSPQQQPSRSVSVSRPQSEATGVRAPGGTSGARPIPILIGAALGGAYAVLSAFSTLEAVGACSFDLLCPEDFVTGLLGGLCISFILWPGLGAVAGWLFSKFVLKPR